MYAGLPFVTFKDGLYSNSKALRGLSGASAHCIHASLLSEEVCGAADSFQDRSADLQELFKLLEGTSHVEHQAVSRQAWR